MEREPFSALAVAANPAARAAVKAPADSPLTCAVCLDAVVLSLATDWVATVVCPTCGRRAPLCDAFREAEASEADFLRGQEIRRVVGDRAARLDPARRFITSRMLCALRRTRSGLSEATALAADAGKAQAAGSKT